VPTTEADGVDAGHVVDDVPFLRALQFADSFLPVGAYSASYGLEQFVEAGDVTDAGDLRGLLAGYLRRQVGPGDVVAIAAAHDAGRTGALDEVARVDRRQRSVTLAAEFRTSSTRSGRRLLEVAAATLDDDAIGRYGERVVDGSVPGNYATALGLVAARAGIPRRIACLLHCHAFVVGLLGAAQRLLQLGHTAAQRALAALQPVAADVCDRYDGAGLEAMRPFAPLVDVRGMEHERADRRLFVS